MRNSETLRDALTRVRRPLLGTGVVALMACAVGAVLSPQQFFRSYLFACVFWTGIALGSLAVLMLRTVTGGSWGIPIRRPLESATRTLPLVAFFFVPLLFGLKSLYEWARPEEVLLDPILKHKASYLNVPFFIGRGILYLAAWGLLVYFLNRWSDEQDRAPSEGLDRRLQLLSSGGLVAYGLTVTFWSIDWIMSLEPHWFSTMYGVMLIAGQALGGLAFAVAVAVLLSRYEPLASVFSVEQRHDLGKLLFAFVMFWAYVSFSQYLIIWAGNLPEEIPWYLKRLQGGWGWFGIALIVLHFLLPFLLMMPAGANRNPKILAGVAFLIVAMRMVDLFWLIRPVFSPSRFTLHWLDFAAPIGVGGVWLSFFLWQLMQRPLIPRNDPDFVNAMAHEQP